MSTRVSKGERISVCGSFFDTTQFFVFFSFLFFDKTVCMIVIVIVIETVWFQKITDVMWILNN